MFFIFPVCSLFDFNHLQSISFSYVEVSFQKLLELSTIDGGFHQDESECNATTSNNLEEVQGTAAGPADTPKKTKIGHSRKSVCPLCGISVLEINLSKHMRTRHDGIMKKYKCPGCEKLFLEKKHMKEHHAIVHEGKEPFMCKKCKKTFNASLYLRRHKCKATLNIQHKCAVCEKVFKSAGYLNDHALNHSIELSYACNKCGKRFKHRQSRNRHSNRCLL